MRKIPVLVLLATAALVFTGCDKNRAEMAPKETNVLGIVHTQDANYGPTGPATITVSSDDLIARKNYSGRKTTLLWGLVTLKDY